MKRNVIALIVSVGLIFGNTLITRLPVVAQENKVIEEVYTLAWNPQSDNNQIAIGGAMVAADKNSASPTLTIHNSKDMSVQLTLNVPANYQIVQTWSVSWSPDGRYLVSGTTVGDMIVWNINDPSLPVGQPVATFGDPANLESVAWSPDGRWIANLELKTDYWLNIWKVVDHDYKLIDRVNVGDGNGLALVWSPNSSALIIGSQVGPVLYTVSPNGKIDLKSRTLLGPTEIRDSTFYNRIVSDAIAWDPSGSNLAFNDGFSNRLLIYDIATNRQVQMFEAPDSVVGLSWSPDRRYLAYSYNDPATKIMKVAVIEIGSGKRVGEYVAGGEFGVDTIAWSPDSSRIAFLVTGFENGVNANAIFSSDALVQIVPIGEPTSTTN